jgi:hypothetical protein
MDAGDWANLNPSGGENAFKSPSGGGSSGHILPYSCDGKWNPKSGEFFYIGGDHNGGPEKFVRYSEAANAWTIETRPPWMSTSDNQNHSYDYAGLDEDKQHFYYNYERYDIHGKSWGSIPAISGQSFGRAHKALEYFPGVGVVWIGDGGVWILADGASAWKTVRPKGSLSFAGLHPVIDYNPVHHIVVFGGGDGTDRLYKMDARENITALGPTPHSQFASSSNGSYIFSDPVSGDMLAIEINPRFSKYDFAHDRWSVISNNIPGLADYWRSNKINNIAIGAVSNYGVIFVIKYDDANSTVWLYKHSEGVSNISMSRPHVPQFSLKVSPNPFNSFTRLFISSPYSAFSSQAVEIKIFDIHGKRIHALAADQRRLTAGLIWNPGHMPSGTYIIKAQTGNKTVSKGVLFQK